MLVEYAFVFVCIAFPVCSFYHIRHWCLSTIFPSCQLSLCLNKTHSFVCNRVRILPHVYQGFLLILIVCFSCSALFHYFFGGQSTVLTFPRGFDFTCCCFFTFFSKMVFFPIVVTSLFITTSCRVSCHSFDMSMCLCCVRFCKRLFCFLQHSMAYLWKPSCFASAGQMTLLPDTYPMLSEASIDSLVTSVLLRYHCIIHIQFCL